MTIKQYLDRYGRKARLTQEDGWESTPFHCFLQPLQYKNKMYLYGVNTRIGYNAQGHYLYIGPPEQDLTALSNDVQLCVDGEHYHIVRAEKVYSREVLIYVWAVVRAVVQEYEEAKSE